MLHHLASLVSPSMTKAIDEEDKKIEKHIVLGDKRGNQ